MPFSGQPSPTRGPTSMNQPVRGMGADATSWALPGGAVAVVGVVLATILAVLASAPSAIARTGEAVSHEGVAAEVTRTEVTRTEVVVQNGDIRLRGAVFAPAAGTGNGRTRRPAFVMVHGAGAHKLERLADQAEEFARRGVVTLVHDKRPEPYAAVNGSFDGMAGDTLAAVRLLRGRPDVDPERLGVWAFSEDAWVAPLAVSRSDQVKFLITVGAGGHSPERVQVWSNANHLTHAGVAERHARPLSVGLFRILTALHVGVTGYDPVPALSRIQQPVLALWGERERTIPPAESARVFADTLDRAGNTRYTIRFFPDADHGLLRTPDGFTQTGGLPAGYFDLVTSWIDGLDEHRSPSVAAPPRQDLVSQPVTPLAWWESPLVQLAALLLLRVAFLVYPVAALIARLRGATPHAAGRAPAVLAATGALTVIGTVLYFGYLLVTATENPGPVLLGRPAVWLALQIVAVIAIAATIRILVTLRRRRPPVRLAALLIGGVVLLPWSIYWGLLIP